ncbi:MAG: hypothetical protein ACLQD8_01350 [Thermoplasmata archaeon]
MARTTTAAGASRIPDRGIYVAFTVAILVTVAGTVLWWAYEPGHPLHPRHPPAEVQVYEVNWERYNNSLETGVGFITYVLWTVPLALWIGCPDFFGSNVQCSTGSVHLLTSGWGLYSTNAPSAWDSGTSGADFLLHVTVIAPSTNFTGELTIDLY